METTLPRKDFSTKKRLALIGEDRYVVADTDILTKVCFCYGYLRSCKGLTLSDGNKLLLIHLLSLRDTFIQRVLTILTEDGFGPITQVHLTGGIFDKNGQKISGIEHHSANGHKFPGYEDLAVLLNQHFSTAGVQIEKTYPLPSNYGSTIFRDVHVIVRHLRGRVEFFEMGQNTRKIGGKDEIGDPLY